MKQHYDTSPTLKFYCIWHRTAAAYDVFSLFKIEVTFLSAFNLMFSANSHSLFGSQWHFKYIPYLTTRSLASPRKPNRRALAVNIKFLP